jgi:hypothetical protein
MESGPWHPDVADHPVEQRDETFRDASTFSRDASSLNDDPHSARESPDGTNGGHWIHPRVILGISTDESEQRGRQDIRVQAEGGSEAAGDIVSRRRSQHLHEARAVVRIEHALSPSG